MKLLINKLILLIFFLVLPLNAFTSSKLEISKPQFLKTANYNVNNFTEFYNKLDDIKKIENYKFDTNINIINRIKSEDKKVIDYLNKLDNTDKYNLYSPTQKDLKKIKITLKKMPKLLQKLFNEKLISLYFVNNFQGSGYVEYIFSNTGEIYFILILNSATLKQSISELLTARDNTTFLNNNSNIKLNIKLSTAKKNNESALLYILLHEGAHIIDYTYQLTPFVEPDLKQFAKTKIEENEFAKNVWLDYKTPIEKYNFAGRDKLSFYYLSGAPKLDIKSADNIYEMLANTPFVSLYASLNWAEDFAELFAVYYLTDVLKMKYKIEISKKILTKKNKSTDKLIFFNEPMKHYQTRNRLSTIKRIIFN